MTTRNLVPCLVAAVLAMGWHELPGAEPRANAKVRSGESTVMLRLTDGSTVDGTTTTKSLGTLRLDQILSVQRDAPASSQEAEFIKSALATVQAGTNRAARDRAVEDLTAIGLPVLGPLLETLKDTDQHEPRPLYRLYQRIMPCRADGFDRSPSLVRLTTGAHLRLKLPEATLILTAGGQTRQIPLSQIRTLAVRQKMVSKTAQVHAIQHCNQIEYLDSGIGLTEASKLTSAATGFARLSWATDGWSCDPNGLAKPGPGYKTHLFEGHPFGALIARVSANGAVFFLGKQSTQTGLPAGRLGLALNDNGHWQNNIGSYFVTLTATHAYDLGDAQ